MATSVDYLTLSRSILRTGDEFAQNLSGVHFVFPKEGTGAYVTRHSSQPLAAGDVFVIQDMTQGRVVTSRTPGLVFYWFTLTFDHLFPLFPAHELSLLDTLAFQLKSGKILPATGAAAGKYHHLLAEVSPDQNLEQRGQLLRIASGILEAEFLALQRGQKSMDLGEQLLMKLLEKLSTDQLLKLPIGDLARKLGCSRRHLNRLFRQHFGCSVITFKMELRLLRAASLLRDPEAKVINIAADCGFNHLGLFNTCFRKRFGHSPTQWRKLRSETGIPVADAGIDKPLISKLSHLVRALRTKSP